MGIVTMKSLLEAGVHFGHGKDKWNPKMAKYIYTTRKGVHIIDLQKTMVCIGDAYKVVRDTVLKGKSVMFVGTKKQAQKIVEDAVTRCNDTMEASGRKSATYYVNNRWLGGMLTNYSTIRASLTKYKKLEKTANDGTYDTLTKKEIAIKEKDRARLEKNLKGIKDMQDLPGVLFVIDGKHETIAIKEARKLGIPVIATVDTNCDPTLVDFPIPANDDAVRAIILITDIICDAVLESNAEFGLQLVTDEDEGKYLETQDVKNKEAEDDSKAKGQDNTQNT